MSETPAASVWQPDPQTIEWVAKQLEWELQRQDSAGPAAMASTVVPWLRRLKADKRRQAEAR